MAEKERRKDFANFYRLLFLLLLLAQLKHESQTSFLRMVIKYPNITTIYLGTLVCVLLSKQTHSSIQSNCAEYICKILNVHTPQKKEFEMKIPV